MSSVILFKIDDDKLLKRIRENVFDVHESDIRQCKLKTKYFESKWNLFYFNDNIDKLTIDIFMELNDEIPKNHTVQWLNGKCEEIKANYPKSDWFLIGDVSVDEKTEELLKKEMINDKWKFQYFSRKDMNEFDEDIKNAICCHDSNLTGNQQTLIPNENSVDDFSKNFKEIPEENSIDDFSKFEDLLKEGLKLKEERSRTDREEINKFGEQLSKLMDDHLDD
ncbi:hypothetical protein SNEBB_007278 [Seison nebaliae]|nr:hypothetical protein SNEBB_007278 [Seison nebaliae]